MCEQITTISILDLQREGSRFMYSFNLDFMNKVDEALAGQLGLKTRVADMKVLENLIDKIAEKKEADLKKRYETNLKMRVEEIAAQLSDRFGIKLSSEDMLNGSVYSNSDLQYAPKEVVKEMKSTTAERMNNENNENSESSEDKISLPWTKDKFVSTLSSDTSNKISTNSVKRKSSSNNKWTTEKMIQFLEDKEKMPLQELADKYNIKKKSVYQMAWMFKERLNKEKEDDIKK